MTIDLIVENIRQLATCAATGDLPKRGEAMREIGLIENGALAINNGKLVGVGTAQDIRAEFASEVVVDASGGVVCPGFVDPHTHIVFGGDRLDEFELKIKGADYLGILANGGGIISTVQKTRKASVEELVAAASVRLDRMLECGTTTCEIKTGYGLDLKSELKILDVIAELDKIHPIDVVPTFLPAHAVPPEFKNGSESYVKLVCDEMLPAAWAWYEKSHFHGRVPFFVDVFCEKNAFDVSQSRDILETGLGLGYSLKAHVDEFTNLGGSRLAIELGATSIDHLDAISDGEVELLAESNATVGVVTPTVNFNFGSREFADARKLIDAGCAVALSTDYNPGSAPCPSMPMAMAIACRYQKLLPAEALNAATINAAYSIGVGSAHGSIEIGKAADFLILDTSDFRQIAYEFGGNLVSSVFKSGRNVSRLR
ncbi:MAG: imidazolonepropionase [Pyrinomonadaceae bacterium]